MSTAISIIEDDPKVRDAFSTIFAGTPGYELLSVHGSAEEALRDLPLAKAQVVLVDIGLPGELNGVDCIRELVSRKTDLILLVFTVFEDNQTLFEALSAGASGYILKRTPPSELLDAIQEAAQGGAPMSRSIARKVLNYFAKGTKAEHGYKLTQREEAIVRGLVRGLSDKELAAHFGLSRHTVRVHLKNIYAKMHVSSRAAAVAKFQGHC